MSASFTCTACASSFDSSEEQRAHYKLDWHRYNLKRKVAGLTPVSREDFERRLAAVTGAAQAKEEYRGQCKDCRKSFGSEKLLQQHLESKKHKDTAAAKAKQQKSPATNSSSGATAASAGGPAAADATASEPQQPELDAAATAAAATPATQSIIVERVVRTPTEAAAAESDAMTTDEQEDGAESEDAEPEAPIGPDICIFCNYRSADGIEANCRHMAQKHGFFIPDAEYLVDCEGLVQYCSEKVKLGHICLVCNGRGRYFHSWRAVQQHMMGVSHCRLCYEEGEDLHEFEDFYDFRASYGDDVNTKPAAAAGSDGSEHEAENSSDEERGVDVPTLSVTHLGELQLLDGRVVGHRQFDRYYKQAVPRADSRASTKALRGEQRLRLLAMYGNDEEAATAAMSQLSVVRAGSSNRALAVLRSRQQQDGQLAGKELQQLRRSQWHQKREALKTSMNNNRLNRTFTRVYEA